MQPSEFWALPVVDWWVELDAHIVEAKRLEAKMQEARTGKVSGGGFSSEEWEAARRRHRERKAK